MPIYRFSAQEVRGLVIDDDRQRAIDIISRDHDAFAALIGRAMTDYHLKFQPCPPGSSEITPTYWRRNRAYHFLHVLPDGENANYHVVQRDHGLTPAEYTPTAHEIVAQNLPETKMIRIPQDQIIFPLVGPVTEDPRMRLHEIIMHSPTPPPF